MANIRNFQDIKKLKILNWNANGVLSKKSELLIYLQSNEVDICCITETHLKEKDKLKFPGYKVYRYDRPSDRKASGGTAIIVKNNINHHELLAPSTSNLEISGISVVSASPLYIFSVYNPPNKRLLAQDLLNIFTTTNPILAIGDLNSKHTDWGCKQTNPNGIRLNQILVDLGLSLHSPSEPTFYRPGRQADILDVVLSKRLSTPVYQQADTALSSDHLPVLISLDTPVEEVTQSNKLIKGKVDWKAFSEILDSIAAVPGSINSVTGIDSFLTQLNLDIYTALDQSTQQVSKSREPRFSNRVPKSILDLIKEKNRTRRLWQRYRTGDLKKKLNYLIHKLKKDLDAFTMNKYQEYLSELSPKDRSLWKATKHLLKKSTPIPTLTTQTSVLQTDKEKCDAFAESLERTFSPSVAEYCRIEDEAAEFINIDMATAELPLRFISPSEIRNIIMKLKLRKSPGHDLIPAIVFKHFSRKVIASLTALFNSCLRIGYFPAAWKHAEIILLKKPGKHFRHIDSYRPISLLPIAGKIFETCIKKRFQDFITKNNIIPNFQFGFTQKHSTIHQLTRLHEFIVAGFEAKKHTVAAFLDFEKAFDKVWHTGLKFKLKKAGLPAYLYQILCSFLDNRTFHVRINTTKSNIKSIQGGTPQGSVLSPLLFIFYIHDMPVDHGSEISLFADDTTVFTQNSDIEVATEILQDTLREINAFLKTWRINLNVTKSVVQIFTLRRPPTPSNLVLNSEELPWVDKDSAVKYLGVYLDRKLTWKIHFNKKLNEGYSRLSQLFPILNRKSSLKPNCSLLLYKSILRPLVTYASEVWGGTHQSKINRLQVFQNKVLRQAVDAPWFVRNSQLHRDLKIEPIIDFITKKYQNFSSNLQFVKGAVDFHLGQPTTVHRLKPRLPQDRLLNC